MKHVEVYDEEYRSPVTVRASQPQSDRSSLGRGMKGDETACLWGLSMSGFQKARREGRIPGPTLPGKRYDRVLQEMEMSKLSGIVENESKPLDEWRKRNGSH